MATIVLRTARLRKEGEKSSKPKKSLMLPCAMLLASLRLDGRGSQSYVSCKRWRSEILFGFD